jgi:hypothetical protein
VRAEGPLPASVLPEIHSEKRSERGTGQISKVLQGAPWAVEFPGVDKHDEGQVKSVFKEVSVPVSVFPWRTQRAAARGYDDGRMKIQSGPGQRSVNASRGGRHARRGYLGKSDQRGSAGISQGR